jgi:hypothetical protein
LARKPADRRAARAGTPAAVAGFAHPNLRNVETAMNPSRKKSLSNLAHADLAKVGGGVERIGADVAIPLMVGFGAFALGVSFIGASRKNGKK